MLTKDSVSCQWTPFCSATLFYHVLTLHHVLHVSVGLSNKSDFMGEIDILVIRNNLFCFIILRWNLLLCNGNQTGLLFAGLIKISAFLLTVHVSIILGAATRINPFSRYLVQFRLPYVGFVQIKYKGKVTHILLTYEIKCILLNYWQETKVSCLVKGLHYMSLRHLTNLYLLVHLKMLRQYWSFALTAAFGSSVFLQ